MDGLSTQLLKLIQEINALFFFFFFQNVFIRTIDLNKYDD